MEYESFKIYCRIPLEKQICLRNLKFSQWRYKNI